ncbi:conserved hypothetical protein [Gluconacetobacter diazotrophicus PA1 5]|uniref:Uncharacterized protein n=1 Tax=Gluconacetobacter diazotrophicus TaxID=33996 RepID=A0A7W4I5Y2_GLUDI|nr:hypothetical protein [Gluconacetobacter diazotrophicus]ACI52308.1 conserved hypothetical protein [Gluconacetobacter diazotrophicus PA1 5]MBB2156859.1 hypothetical protein [Gluconacetobacter diazotrophicus]TWB04797.1 hypothetical protein FBZ86_11919 [Gluconacetobacter diazotrophicus]
MPEPSRQTLPVGDRPFVDGTGALTLSAYQFLARLQAGASATIRNVQVIAAALGVPVASIPADGSAPVTLPASYPPVPDVSAGLRDSVADARLLAMLSGASRPDVSRPVAARDAGPPPAAPPPGVVVLHNGARVLDGFGVPAGRVAGWIGDLYLQRDGGAAGALWSKRQGAGTETGWAPAGGAAGVLPLVNGDTGPVGILSDPAGQTIGVPI